MTVRAGSIRPHDAQFLRLTSRRGPKKAILAVANSMLTAAYYMLRDGVEYEDLGDQYFVHHDKERLTKSLVKRLRDLGVEVEVKKAAMSDTGIIPTVSA